MQLAKKIKELQNLYSWNQFYQERKMRKNMKNCQVQINEKKKQINEFKVAQKTKKKGAKK